MTNFSDPTERLRAANPVPADRLALLRPDPALFSRITTGAGIPAPALRLADRPRRARRLVPALVVAGLAAGGVAYTFLRGEVTKPLRVACYAQADLRADTAIAEVDSRGPVAACADLWRRGAFGPGADAPALVECVLSSGVAGVFPTAPGEDVCSRLNLPFVPSTAPPVSSPGTTLADLPTRILAFRDAVAPAFVDGPCLEPGPAAVIVRRELDRAGLGDWTVRGGEGQAGDGFSAARPCASLSVRPETREVVLVPVPRR